MTIHEKEPKPGERTAEEMLEGIESMKKALERIEAARAQRQTKVDGYIGHVVI